MLKQVICNIVQFASFLIYNVVVIFKLVNFQKDINKKQESPNITSYSLEILKLLGISFVALIVSSISTVVDGLYDQTYIVVPFVIAFCLGLLNTIALNIYFARVGKKYNILEASYDRGIFALSLFFAVFHAVTVGQFVYTLILIS